MYSVFEGGDTLVVPVGDKPKLKKGFEVTTASGDVEYVNKKDLNIPNGAFRRIYTGRAFGYGTPDQVRARYKRNFISQAVFEKFYPDTANVIDWGPRIIDMLNTTLERKASDPNYIVKVNVSYEFTNFDRKKLRQGDLSEMNSEIKTSVMTKVAPMTKVTP